ncbi:MAG: UDP-N-acetylmuramate dehydrogenase [Candidatus Delongbacteria bacterium]|nr:UDP-N-acetylmuramate dehydrogenase [Candidatus Delongbacteria bacterium]
MQTDFSLKDYNSFHFNVKTRYFETLKDPAYLKNAIINREFDTDNLFILGGGSNVFFRDNFHGLVLHPVGKEIEVIEENEAYIVLEVSAGYDWDEFVAWTVEKGYCGLENLSLIPGQVGAAPIQNIGAYGVEVKDYITVVKGIYLDTGADFEIPAEACRFDYRDSIFKHELRGKVFISHMQLRLNKQPDFNISYGQLEEQLKGTEITQQAIRDAVIEIREQKLPDPDVIGNAGSFFKNPIVQKAQYDFLKSQYPEIKAYPAGNDMMKISAAWMIDNARWKAYRVGDAGVHPKQALVLVNYGMAKPRDIMSLAEQIRKDILFKFGIELEMEVRLV